jgi:hypothetical protein
MNILTIIDGPAYHPNKTRRVRVQGRAAGAGRFVTCIDVNSGEQLTVHVSKLSREALPLLAPMHDITPIPVC